MNIRPCISPNLAAKFLFLVTGDEIMTSSSNFTIAFTCKIGFSRFWHNFQDGTWYPSKEPFFFKTEVCEKLFEKISFYAAEIGQLGLCGMRLLY